MATLVNLTEHPIIEMVTGTKIEPSGIVARISTDTRVIDRINNIPIYHSKCTAIEGLPDPTPDTVYIVSALVLEHVPTDRLDVVRIGNAHRVDGRIVGCRGFRRNQEVA